ncbi:hypothetical protein O9G_001700 [Rozella allomycis CSF55]|uniref:Uncharacterized protein n=1 Tax=Rozella allomycis (strain CSF55) TaxID=988480 RepID=A0A075AXC6_ROZAC|nr:hypothetical protein O9G_001700 [Rozella allomycis CSF55]|eukprot:EPZ34970.1 hypothetical protein O9G_001700 [Rozella allomycis CSF55]
MDLSKAYRAYEAMNGIFPDKDNCSTLRKTKLITSDQVCDGLREIKDSSIKFLRGQVEIPKLIVCGVEFTNGVMMGSPEGDDFLLENGSPAPFGKGKETVYDESVRLAKEIAAKDIEIDMKLETKIDNDRFLPFDEWEIETIKEEKCYMDTLECDPALLFSSLALDLKAFAPPFKKLVPKLYKLHIYGQGGFFEEHVDTLHAPNHYGTLIVGISEEYAGGDLELFHDYIMFHTDVKHRVKPVTSGVRAVLQFDLYAEDDPNYTSIIKKQKIERHPLLTTLEDCIDFQKKSVSFLCRHEYPMFVDPSLLKTVDYELYKILSEEYDLRIGIAFNVVKQEGESEIELSKSTLFRVTTAENIDAMLKFIETGEKKDQSNKEVLLFSGWGTSFTFLSDTPYIEYTGNESQAGTLTYTTTVISILKKKASQ